MRNTATSLILLFIILLIAGWYYDYPGMLHLLPQGSHIWRQADCFAMAENFRQFNLPFFEPATYNLESFKGKVAGEFPVFYFLAGKFENTALALRSMHTCIFLCGIIAVYFIAFYFFRRRFLSLLVSVSLFSSPLLVFYGNNFLSDVPALSFSFMGWAFFLFSNREKKLWLFAAAVCFGLAGLLKASQSLQIMLATILLFYHYKNSKIHFRQFVFSTVLLLSSFCIILSWYYYARSYNHQNGNTYYFLSIAPIWKMDIQQVITVFKRIFISWSNNYFWLPTLLVLIFSLYPLLRNRHMLNAELKAMLTGTLMLTVIYIMVFMDKLQAHEYYYTFFFTFIAFYLIALLKIYNAYHSENVFTHAFLVILAICNGIYCGSFVKEKLTYSYYNPVLASDEMQRFLIANGVDENASIISVPDISPNQSLSLLERRGYTNFNALQDVLQKHEADFLLDASSTTDSTFIKHIDKQTGEFNGIKLYRLK